VFVDENHGVGMEIEKQPLKEIMYTGRSVRVKK
jgi:hypothetical protein